MGNGNKRTKFSIYLHVLDAKSVEDLFRYELIRKTASKMLPLHSCKKKKKIQTTVFPLWIFSDAFKVKKKKKEILLTHQQQAGRQSPLFFFFTGSAAAAAVSQSAPTVAAGEYFQFWSVVICPSTTSDNRHFPSAPISKGGWEGV